MRTLVLGGIRSGKSDYAESLLLTAATNTSDSNTVRYIATAAAPTHSDLQWCERIAAHQKNRPAHWITVETANLVEALKQDPHSTTIIEDLGTWLTRQYDELDAWGSSTPVVTARCHDLLSAISNYHGRLVLVSPEVGLTVVPATGSGRQFADALGILNRTIAQVCEHAVLVVAGLPITLK